MAKKRVIILGAGPAGLTAGYELLKRSRDNYDVLILEQLDKVGGIARSEYLDNNIIDIGGHRFYSKDKKVISWWNSFIPRAGKPAADDIIRNCLPAFKRSEPDPEIEDDVMLLRKRVSRIFNESKFYSYPFELDGETKKNLGFKEYSKALSSLASSKMNKNPEQNLEDYYINQFGKYVYEKFFENYTEKLWGKHPAEIYYDWGQQRVKGLELSLIGKNDEESFLDNYYWYPKYGPGQLWSKVEREFINLGGKIIKECTVTGLTASKGSVSSVSCRIKDNKKEETLYGDIIISSLPLKELITNISGTDVPDDIKNIANGLAYRDMQVVGLLVNKLNFSSGLGRSRGGFDLIDDSWIYIQDPSVKLGRIQIYNNRSPYMTEDFRNSVWLGLEYFCQEGDNYWSMTDEEMEDYAAQELVSIGFINYNDIIKSKRIKIKKAYPVYFGTYSKIERLTDYLNNFENLYCIGRNGQHCYRNMDHVMETAFETVDNILLDKKSKANIWSVHTNNYSYFEDIDSPANKR